MGITAATSPLFFRRGTEQLERLGRDEVIRLCDEHMGQLADEPAGYTVLGLFRLRMRYHDEELHVPAVLVGGRVERRTNGRPPRDVTFRVFVNPATGHVVVQVDPGDAVPWWAYQGGATKLQAGDHPKHFAALQAKAEKARRATAKPAPPPSWQPNEKPPGTLAPGAMGKKAGPVRNRRPA